MTQNKTGEPKQNESSVLNETYENASKIERFISGVEQFNRVFNVIFVFFTGVATLSAVVFLIYTFTRHNKNTHTCTVCQKQFSCQSNGKTKKATAQKIHRFKRKTVNIGNFPIEISQAENKKDFCCTREVQGKHLRFCTFQCYLECQKQTPPNETNPRNE